MYICKRKTSIVAELSDMENMIEKLNKYFNTTSRDQVLKDWEKTKEFDQVGPIMDEFLNETNWFFRIKLGDPINESNLVFNNYSPKFSSGFFLTNRKKHATGSILYCQL